MFSWFLQALCLSAFIPLSNGFNFSATSPLQCGDMMVSWMGGKPPISLTIVPANGTPKTTQISVPAARRGPGQYRIPVNFPKGTNIVLSMSDATGFGSGGVSALMTVAGPAGNASCNTTVPSLDFTFKADDNLRQCADYTIGGFNGTTSPISIQKYPINGLATTTTINAGSNYTFKAPYEAGSSVIFCLTDTKGHNGGCTGVIVSHPPNNTSCLQSTPISTPTSTSANPTVTETITGTITSTSSSKSGKGKGLPPGATAMIGVGSGVGVVVTGVLITICVRRRKQASQRDKPESKDSTFDLTRNSNHTNPSLNSIYASTSTDYDFDPYNPEHLSHPVVDSTSEPASPYFISLDPEHQINPFVARPSEPGPLRSSKILDRQISRSDGHLGSTRTSKVLVHTDIAEGAAEEVEEVVELPPHYRSSRVAIPGIESSSSRPRSQRKQTSSGSVLFANL